MLDFIKGLWNPVAFWISFMMSIIMPIIFGSDSVLFNWKWNFIRKLFDIMAFKMVSGLFINQYIR